MGELSCCEDGEAQGDGGNVYMAFWVFDEHESNGMGTAS
jgi:hypothetical protein